MVILALTGSVIFSIQFFSALYVISVVVGVVVVEQINFDITPFFYTIPLHTAFTTCTNIYETVESLIKCLPRPRMSQLPFRSARFTGEQQEARPARRPRAPGPTNPTTYSPAAETSPTWNLHLPWRHSREMNSNNYLL